MTPVFSHGDLRLYLLSLLDESPRHGYDLMQALSDRTGGTYTPSAGTIYPRLAKLEEEGLVTKTVDGRKTRSEEHTSELQSLMRISYAVFCLKKKKVEKVTALEHHQKELTKKIRTHRN